MSLDETMRAALISAGMTGAAAALDMFADVLDEYILTQDAVSADDRVLSINDVTRLVRLARDRTSGVS